jgi:hypothetical protein
LIEAKQGMITGAGKMSVVGRAFLLTIGLADRTVHVQGQVPHGPVFLQPVNPAPRQCVQRLQVLGLRQYFSLEAPHLAGRSRRAFRRPPANYLPHCWINREPFGVVGVLIPCQPAVEGLPQQRDHRMLGVLARAPIVQQC